MKQAIDQSHKDQQIAMIKGQLATNGIHAPNLINALMTVDRARFVPAGLSHVAYVDDEIRLGQDRYLLEPLLFARLIAYADIEPNHRVLDIGAGLGYSSAVLAHMARQVIGVEESPELVTLARKKLAKAGLQHLDLITAPLDAGCRAHQPYDRIIIEGLVNEVPTSLEEQLADGGTIVAIRAAGPAFATKKALGDIIIGTKHHDIVSYVEKDRCCAYPVHHMSTNDVFRFQ